MNKVVEDLNNGLSFVNSLEVQYLVGLERIHQVTNTIRIAIQGGEYDTYREYTFSQRLN